MAKSNYNVLEKLADKFDNIADDKAKEVVDIALKQAKEDIDKLIHKALRKSNLPAKGKYSKGRSEKAIIAYNEVTWEGLTGSIKIGFDYKISITPAFLMYGTPKFKPVRGLKTALKLSDKKKTDIVSKIIDEVIEEMNL